MKKQYMMPRQTVVDLTLTRGIAQEGMGGFDASQGVPDAMARRERDFDEVIEEETTSAEFQTPRTVWQTGW